MIKTILVTGGAGHVGSHVVELLAAKKNHAVISLDNYFSGKKQYHIEGVDYRTGHTKDIDKLIPEPVDVVYHFGEYARVATSFDDVAMIYDMNMAGTFSVLEFCRKRKVGKLVYIGSSTRFAIEGDGRFQNPYSFTKAANVDLVNCYGRWYNLPYAICYFFNAFGPREHRTGKYATLIGRFEHLYLQNLPLTVDLPGTQKRYFTYVKDIARGVIDVGEKAYGDGFSLNSAKAYSVIDIAKAFGCPIQYRQGYSGRLGSGDIPERAHKELAWSPTIDVLDYIREFKEQYTQREHHDDQETKIRAYSG